jgi:hypothetical protein
MNFGTYPNERLTSLSRAGNLELIEFVDSRISITFAKISEKAL